MAPFVTAQVPNVRLGCTEGTLRHSTRKNPNLPSLLRYGSTGWTRIGGCRQHGQRNAVITGRIPKATALETIYGRQWTAPGYVVQWRVFCRHHNGRDKEKAPKVHTRRAPGHYRQQLPRIFPRSLTFGRCSASYLRLIDTAGRDPFSSNPDVPRHIKRTFWSARTVSRDGVPQETIGLTASRRALPKSRYNAPPRLRNADKPTFVPRDVAHYTTRLTPPEAPADPTTYHPTNPHGTLVPKPRTNGLAEA
ncbi:hypothetical protein GGTG_05977 [Gaeumannomyces tritici R3-111a-1]|uniref:Uncharacterized protein n=1 Tax=Gaeumannomyces tritici (strain R3-111a-1) TaxID=644352 RepID=J3NXH1_GAET3|nr:hypothetical protein GGTG_05977 [Gaeumannomyces tritici R3-111a-1]EJT76053.1 hypothetical protein GGTG_05977 [Gaeumannomyces tritici R3-111a-1]